MLKHTVIAIIFSLPGLIYANFCFKSIDSIDTSNVPNCEFYIQHDLQDGSNTYNATCLEENVFVVKYNATKANPSTSTNYGRHLADIFVEEGTPPRTGTIKCKSTSPMDFDFEGVGALDFFGTSKSKYTDDREYVLRADILLLPEVTGKYIISLMDDPTIQTSFFIFVERGSPPYLIGTSRPHIQAIEINETVTIFPCVASDSIANITLHEKKGFDEIWIQLDALYNPFNGFILNSTSVNPQSEYRCYSDFNSSRLDVDNDFVTIKTRIQKPKNSSLFFEFVNGTTAVCYSKETENKKLDFKNIFARNPTEAKFMELCLRRRNPYCGSYFHHLKRDGHKIPSRTCPNNSTNCVWITNIHPYGLLYCQSEDYDEDYTSTTYFTGLDNKIYTNISAAPTNALIIPLTELSSTDMTFPEVICRMSPFHFANFPWIISAKYTNGSIVNLTETNHGVNQLIRSDMSELICGGYLWETNERVDGIIQINDLGRGCLSDRFVCKIGTKCTLLSFVCDGDNDCGDYSDERNCSEHHCNNGGFKCANGNCIQLKRKCNNLIDCSDGSDESADTCSQNYCTTTTHFKCTSGQCLAISKRCDGSRDCIDGSDEINCTYIRTTVTPYVWRSTSLCSSYQFECKSGACINRDYICDGDRDCTDNSDEEKEKCDAHTCAYDRFRCSKGNSSICVSGGRKCDNKQHCDDGSDESYETCKNQYCDSSQFKCTTGQCISSYNHCNGDVNCLDGSDELNCEDYYPKFLQSESVIKIDFSPLNPINEIVCEVVNTTTTHQYKPTISWWRRGHNMSETHPGFIWRDNTGLKLALRFTNFTSDDNGEYICLAHNRLKKVSLVYIVNVIPLTTSTEISITAQETPLQSEETNKSSNSSTAGILALTLVLLVIMIFLLVLVRKWWLNKSRRGNFANGSAVRMLNRNNSDPDIAIN